MAESSSGRGVTVDRHDGVWLVILTGEFDLANVKELRWTLESLLAAENVSLSRPTVVLVDFSQVTFMDSIVIEALIHAHALAEPNREVRLAVVVDSPESFPARLLRLVGVTRRVPTLADRATALSALTSQGPH